MVDDYIGKFVTLFREQDGFRVSGQLKKLGDDYFVGQYQFIPNQAKEIRKIEADESVNIVRAVFVF